MPEAGGASADEPPRASPQASPEPLSGAAAAARDRSRGRWLLLALAAGAVHALSFAPAGLPWLALLALGVVFRLAFAAEGPLAAGRLGFAFGCGWLGVGFSWLYISLHDYGGLPVPLAALAVAVLAAGLALLPALALAAAAACGPADSARRALAAVAAWTLADWLRGIVFTGMPWLATGYAHTDGPLAGYAPVLGVYGVGAVAALVVATSLWAGTRAGPGARLLAALGIAAVLGGGAALRTVTWTHDAGAPIRVRLVQGNIPQDLKFGEGGLAQALERYVPALGPGAAQQLPEIAHVPAPPGMTTARPDLIVLPESAFPVPFNDLPDDVLDVLMNERLRQGAALIFGAFIVEPGERYYNSAIGLDGSAAPMQRYSKRHLVPFGEFIPFGFRWFVDLMNIPIGDQERGARYQPPMALAGQQIAVNICFEDLFGAQILDAWHDPARQPTMLLNLSNLAWFDDSIALPQHLQISRMRALETGRPLVRATNTGITAIIDARGRVLAQLPVQTPPTSTAVLEGMVQGKDGLTPFIRTGNRPIWILSALTLLGCRLLPGASRLPLAARKT